MRLPFYFRSLTRNLFRRRQVDKDLSREVNSYLEMLVALNLEAGMSDREARRAALIELGGGQHVEESVREVRAGHVLESVLQDLKYALRTLAKTPAFTAVAVLTLGLGVGANSAIFSVINGVLLKSLPFQGADRLAVIRTTYTGGVTGVTSWKDFDDFRTQSKSFERMAMFDRTIMVLSGHGDASVVQGGVAGPDFFGTFQVQPRLGRPFSQQDCEPKAPKVLGLGEGFWKQEFGADPKVIGRTLIVDGYEATVVNIVPDLFNTFMDRPQIWAPLPRTQEEPRDSRHLWAVGRLRPGVIPSQASKEITSIADSLQKAYPKSNEGWSASVLSLRESVVGDTRPMLVILFGVVAMVLLVACANIANLLLARGASRRKEVAVRSALGASRMRLLRQFLAEGLVLSILGAAVALALASAAMKMLVAIAPADIPRLSDISLDRSVVVFTVVLALATNFVFGLLPAARVSGTDRNTALKEAGRGIRGDRTHSRLRSLLVVSELAISLVLLIGCGLLVRSFYDVIRVKPGFDPERMIVAKLNFPDRTYEKSDAVAAFYDRLQGELISLPAESAAVCTNLPLRGGGLESWGFLSREGEARNSKTTVASQLRCVSPGYFRTMGIPVLAGRDFNQFDKKGGPEVTILSQSLARQLWGDENNAVGKRISSDGDKSVEVIGVVGDVKPWGLDGTGDPGSYAPLAQALAWPMIVVARSKPGLDSGSAAKELIQSIRNVVRSIDSGVAVFSVKTMNEIVDTSLAQRRFYMTLMSILAGLSFLLAAIGTYGVISYSVAERTQEIGIRMALGASRHEILTLVVGQGFKLAVVGSAIGVIAAVSVTRVIESFLFNIKPRDPITFAAVSAFLVAVALAASYLPARRATKVDPNSALRLE